MSKDTPISRYLASLDRRHSLYAGGGGNAVLPESPGVFARPNLTRNFDFDDTFYREDQSMLTVPSPPKIFQAPGTPFDRKRKLSSLYEDDSEKLSKRVDELERLLRQTQADLIDSRATVTTLQHQKNESETNYTIKLINHEQECKKLKSLYESSNEKAQALEEKVLKLEKKHQEAAEEFSQQKSVNSKQILALQDRVAKLQSSNSDLQEKLHQETLKSGDVIRKLQAELEGTEKGAEKWIIESQTTKNQFELLQAQLAKCQNELKDSQAVASRYEELKAKYDKLNVDAAISQANQETIKKWENLFVQEQIHNRQLTSELANLQSENSILRTTMSSEMVLKEKVSVLEKRVSHMTEELKAKVACDADRTQLRHEVKEWKTIAAKLTSACTTPVQFESFLRQNQNLLLEYKHENSNLALELENHKRCAEKLQGDMTSIREQMKVVKDEKDKLASDLKKTSKRLVLIAQDRDSLKGLKDSYEQEFEGQSSESKELQKRNNDLETLITEYEQIISDDPAFGKKPCDKCEELSNKVNTLNEELDRTKRDLEERNIVASTNLTQLPASDDLSAADASFKILSYGKNPSMLSIEERLKELLEENERLKTKIRQLEQDSTSHNLDATIIEEKHILEEKLKTLERKWSILQSAYDYETTQLQVAVNKLFGYHIVLSREPQSQIRLQSVNSPNSQDVFIFQQSDNGDWMLLETPILEVFRQEIEEYLVQAGQIPSFLSIVTIRYAQGIQQQFDETVVDQQQQEQLQQQQHHHATGTLRAESAPTHQQQQQPEEVDDDDDDVEEYAESEPDELDANAKDYDEEDEHEASDDGEDVEEEEEEEEDDDYDDDDNDDDGYKNAAVQRKEEPDDDDDDDIMIIQ